MAQYHVGVFGYVDSVYERYVEGVLNTTVKTTAFQIPVKNGEKGIYYIEGTCVDVTGLGIVSTKILDFSRTFSGGVWTTALALNPVLAPKRSTGFGTGVDWGAEVSADGLFIVLTVTGIARELNWRLTMSSGVQSTHPANLP